MAAYQKFGQEHAAAIRGGAVLHPTATATTVRVTGARGGDVVTGDGPYEAATWTSKGHSRWRRSTCGRTARTVRRG